MADLNIAFMVGSTRSGSLNVRLAKALAAVAPQGLRFTTVRMDDLPFYHAELEGKRPAEVDRFTDAIDAADAVIMVMPEYNRSMPAVIKNAIDWASKPADRNVWRDKPTMTAGTSPGAIGTAVGQQHLRQVLSVVGAYVMPGEVYLSFQPADLIGEDGTVTVEGTRAFLASAMTRFAAFAERFGPLAVAPATSARVA